MGYVEVVGRVVVELVTLPVEFDASARAKRLAVESGIIGEDERSGMNSVLNAAALTYVAAFVSSSFSNSIVFSRSRFSLVSFDSDRVLMIFAIVHALAFASCISFAIAWIFSSIISILTELFLLKRV